MLRSGATPSAAPARSQRTLHALSVVPVAGLATVATAAATVRYVTSDPAGSLLVAEQILVNGVVQLDAYPDSVLERFWTFVPLDGSVHYFWPIGSSLSSVPFVAAFKLAGLDIVRLEPNLQILIAAALASATVVLLYALARFFLGHWLALGLAGVFWFASPLASVTGTALWSINWAVVYGLLSLILSVGTVHRGWSWASVPLAVTLALGYVTRPTMALLVVVIVGYLAVRARKAAVQVCLALAACAAVWVAFSLSVYGTWTPPYYQPTRLGGSDVWVGLAGVLASPGRGLLVYLPLLLVLPLLLALPREPRWRDRALTVAMVSWVALLVVVVAAFSDWYGGWSYGPRLLTESMPAVFLLLVLLWPDAFPGAFGRTLLALLLALAAWGVVTHTVQGLFNPWTQRWNKEPEVNQSPATLWDWRYPPFLHSEERQAARLVDYRE